MGRPGCHEKSLPYFPDEGLSCQWKTEFSFPGKGTWKRRRSFFVDPRKNSQHPASNRSESRGMTHLAFSQDPEPSELGPFTGAHSQCHSVIHSVESCRTSETVRDSAVATSWKNTPHFLSMKEVGQPGASASASADRDPSAKRCMLSVPFLGLGPISWCLKVIREHVSRES